MIIRGGQVFVMDDDILPKVTITGSSIIMDCADNSLEGMTEFISSRVGSGSAINYCTFKTLAQWSNSKASEALGKAKSEVHQQEASIMHRIRKFLKSGEAS